ncbi:rhodanese-like domain-containing protein [Paenibacillus sp. RC67]|uniref:rhodanese-like domain-containing protein n=1 Tax=Paenibacillus sp. RC67 TaxID=3039392 RepID=UPI0024ACCFDB|nr:rhodanese-like domain-containing protein [Paenibacillus sp. RC67]
MIKYVVLFIILFIFYQRIRPVKGLKYMDANQLCVYMKSSPNSFVLLDIRDSVDYYAGHLEGAVHISLGRLPFVKKKELSAGSNIILVSDSKYHSKKAARILKKAGFPHLIALNKGRLSCCINKPIGI